MGKRCDTRILERGKGCDTRIFVREKGCNTKVFVLGKDGIRGYLYRKEV